MVCHKALKKCDPQLVAKDLKLSSVLAATPTTLTHFEGNLLNFVTTFDVFKFNKIFVRVCADIVRVSNRTDQKISAANEVKQP